MHMQKFSFIKCYLLECVVYFSVANERNSLLGLFPDVSLIVNSEAFVATI